MSALSIQPQFAPPECESAPASVLSPKHFVIFATDRPGAAAVRRDNRERHRAYIRVRDSNGVVAVLGGPTFDTAGNMNGTMLVVEAADAAAATAFFASDPYSRAGLFLNAVVREWLWGLGR